MRIIAFACLRVASCVLLVVFFAFNLSARGAFVQNPPLQSSQFIPVLRKSVDLVEGASPSGTQHIITIRLDGLRPFDVVNIRPMAQSRIEVAAGTLAKRLDSDKIPSPSAVLPTPGPALPNSSLEVGTNKVSFVRPVLLDSIVFLDIQVPRQVQVRVMANREIVLMAALQQPLSFSNKEWGQGHQAVVGTTMRAAGLLSRSVGRDNGPVFDRSRGYYVVPSSSLQIVKKLPLEGKAGLKGVVMLQIDETGRVVKISSMTDMAIENLEENLMKWEFAPYKIDGQAVPLVTFLPVKVK